MRQHFSTPSFAYAQVPILWAVSYRSDLAPENRIPC